VDGGREGAIIFSFIEPDWSGAVAYKSVMTYSPDEKRYRIGRFVWTVGTVGDGTGYSCKLSVALQWSFPFLRITLRRAYGGIYP